MTTTGVEERRPNRALDRNLREARRRIVSDARKLGSTEREIQQVLARQTPPIVVSLGTVHNDLKVIEARWRAEAHVDWDLLVGRSAVRLNDARDELRQVARVQVSKALQGDVQAARALATVDRTLVAVEARLARLYGYDAPLRHEVSGPDGEAIPVSIEERAGSIADDIDAWRQAQAEGDAAEAAASEPAE